MDRRQLWRQVRRVWVALGLSATVIFVGWSLIAFRASPEAKLASQSDATVAIQYFDGIWSFSPAVAPAANAPAFIFFPGSVVSPLAYAPLLRAVAAAGFASYLVELPRRGALGGAKSPELEERIDRVLGQATTTRRWVIAGHSRGAVVAAELASQRRKGFAGLVLIGTTHPRDVDLSSLDVPVTKVVGTRDGIARPSGVEANREKLPSATRWVWVEGGNHSQFGWYGFQPGDRRATVSASMQHDFMIQAVLDALVQAKGNLPVQLRSF